VAILSEAKEQVVRFALEAQTLSAGLARGYSDLFTSASTDGLLGIANRAKFEDRLIASVSEVNRGYHSFSLIMFDLDHFKRINDTFGHHVGDRVLKEVVSAVQSKIRDADLLARYGGEEFALLLPYTHPQAACQMAERLLAAVRDLRIKVNEEQVQITISAGVAFTGDLSAGLEAGKLVEEADRQLYMSKAAGRDTWHYRNKPASGLRSRIWKYSLLRTASRVLGRGG
jgi:diguanylate cyclase (GGDEF)-like protein